MKPAGAHSRSSPLHSPQTSPAEKKRRFTQYLSPDPRTHFARTPGDRALDVRPPAPASPWCCQPECRLLTSPAQPPAFPAGARPKLAHHSSGQSTDRRGLGVLESPAPPSDADSSAPTPLYSVRPQSHVRVM